MITLKVRPLQSAERPALSTETFLASLHPLSETVSLELASQEGKVCLLVRCPDDIAPSVEAQLYAQHPDVEIETCEVPDIKPSIHLSLAKADIYPIRRHPQFTDASGSVEPLAAIAACIARCGGRMSLSVTPLHRHKGKEALVCLPKWKFPARWFCRVVFARGALRHLFRPLRRFLKEREPDPGAVDKVSRLLFTCTLRLEGTKELAASFRQFTLPQSNGFKAKRRSFTLSAEEIATLWHVPGQLIGTPVFDWAACRSLPPPAFPPGETVPMGDAVFRGVRTTFGIHQNDRRRHVYVIGKTGVGKSVFLENMINADIQSGRGVGVIDPHGDLIDACMKLIPASRTNDVLLLDPSDTEHPVAFNPLDCEPSQRSLAVSGVVGVFKKMWPDSWGPRLEHILRNTLLALVEAGDSSLLGVPRMYSDTAYRTMVLSKVADPQVRGFWEGEFGMWDKKQRAESLGPVRNKVGQLLSSPLLRNVVGQAKNTVDLRAAMDSGRIVLVNLSKGRLGEDSSAFLGAALVTRFQLDAMGRANVPERDRRDFHLFVDEFQNFATESFASILSEARKYRLCLVLANQYVGQIGDTLREAVFGNVGSLLCFQTGPDDAEVLSTQFEGRATPEDILGLPKYRAYLRLTIDGSPSKPFSVATPPPPKPPEDAQHPHKVRHASRQRYARRRKDVEARLAKWAAKKER